MTDENGINEGNKDKVGNSLELLKRYAIEALISLLIFLIFIGTSLVAEYIARRTGGFGVVFRIIGWSISACGALCCICLVARNTIVFLSFLITDDLEEKSTSESNSK
jgi:hypothetical protein